MAKDDKFYVHADAKGLRRLRKAMKEAEIDLAHMNDLNLEIAQEVLSESFKTIPFKTGRLQSTGKAKGYRNMAKVSFGTRSIKYANLQHWGSKTSKNIPRNVGRKPWAWSAVARLKRRITKKYEKFLKEMTRIIERKTNL